MNYYKWPLLFSLIMLQGCAPRSDMSSKNRTLSPPADSEWVTVGIKLPAEIEALPLNVLYRSEICKSTEYNSSGNKYYIPGFNPNKVTLDQQGNSDIYQTKIALNGGGSCQWQLSEVWMAIQPIHNTRLAYKNYDIIPTGWMKFYFDDRSDWNKNLIKKSGEIEIKRDIFPMIMVYYRSNENVFTLFDGNNDLWKNFRVFNARNILFHPIYHQDNIIKVEGAKNKNDRMTVFYPDGVIEKGLPNYDKFIERK